MPSAITGSSCCSLANRLRKTYLRPTMIDGWRIVHCRPDAATSASASPLLRWYRLACRVGAERAHVQQAAPPASTAAAMTLRGRDIDLSECRAADPSRMADEVDDRRRGAARRGERHRVARIGFDDVHRRQKEQAPRALPRLRVGMTMRSPAVDEPRHECRPTKPAPAADDDNRPVPAMAAPVRAIGEATGEPCRIARRDRCRAAGQREEGLVELRA